MILNRQGPMISRPQYDFLQNDAYMYYDILILLKKAQDFSMIFFRMMLILWYFDLIQDSSRLQYDFSSEWCSYYDILILLKTAQDFSMIFLQNDAHIMILWYYSRQLKTTVWFFFIMILWYYTKGFISSEWYFNMIFQGSSKLQKN